MACIDVQPAFVCLCVCLLATLHKNYWTDLQKNSASEVSVDREELIKFWKVICFWVQIQEFYERFFNIARCGIFPHFGSYLGGGKLTRCLQKFYQRIDASLNKEVPIKLWKSSGSRFPDTGSGLQIQTISASVEIYTYRVLVPFLVCWHCTLCSDDIQCHVRSSLCWIRGSSYLPVKMDRARTLMIWSTAYRRHLSLFSLLLKGICVIVFSGNVHIIS